MSTQKAIYKRLGNSGLSVSVPILGTMGFGTSQWLDWIIEEDRALPIFKEAFDRGINTWDTADTYSNGLSEVIVGKAIRKYNIPREQLVIMTKCYFPVGDTPESRAFWTPEPGQTAELVNRAGLSRKALFGAVDASLKRMGLEYIDLFQIHRADPATPPRETMEALHDLVKAGKIRYIGASSMRTWQFALYQQCAHQYNLTPFISMQSQYSLLYREEEREMIPYCKATGVGLIPWAPLARGYLAKPNIENTVRAASEPKGSIFDVGKSEADQEIIRRVKEIADRKGWSMATVASVWVAEKVTAPIVGMGSVQRVAQALEICGKVLTVEERRSLEEPYVQKEVVGHA
ncbi:Aldo/keto reductase [Choiromyces venosus 120613-1]|uniref:Aldo/keto reductase n=1 Tax=Choiromyces venosus 120613-1 TaxID=1336337 RepID=A0A3N4K0V5_9PEZI|nr:Aldo/keto reductase [Choiromyces venosus 120613-1]